MADGDEFTAPGHNRILDLLLPEEADRLRSHLQRVDYGLKQFVFHAHDSITFVLFPLSGVFSLVMSQVGDDGVEVGTIGNEGMVGLPVFLGADSMPFVAFCQVPGPAYRLGVEAFREELGWGGTLATMLARYTQGFFNQIAQSAACNTQHPMEERLSRWLLMTHDRVGSDRFPLTHEFMAQMLGVRRATVTIALGMLQKAGLIRYSRGTVDIQDREGLENASCECYAIIKKEYDRLLLLD
jgi:CRP-like cAMP-binding protein